jgi:RHS repeat-associated protein
MLSNTNKTYTASGQIDYYPFGMERCLEGGTSGFSATYNSGTNPYLFGGKEIDRMNGLNEYDFTGRWYDQTIGRWGTVDPLCEKYYSISPYAYCHNNPINMIDPNGMGDYYTKNGIRLGSDGINDHLAYTSSGVTNEDIKDEDGNVTGQKTTFNDSQKLSITNEDLNIYANTVAAESSGNKTESFAIASAISNISKYKRKDILKTIQSEGIYGYKDGGNSTNYKNNSKNGMAAAINALTGGTDYSGGALRWDGFDLAAKGFNHVKARTFGIEISDNNFNAFKAAWPDKLIKAYSGGSYIDFSNNFTSGLHPATQGNNKGLVLYQATIVLGRTIFWGPKSKRSGL